LYNLKKDCVVESSRVLDEEPIVERCNRLGCLEAHVRLCEGIIAKKGDNSAGDAAC